MNKEYNFSIEKLLSKINKCIIKNENLEKYKNIFNLLIESIETTNIDKLINFKIHELFNYDNYYLTYNYLQNNRLYNVLVIINDLLLKYEKDKNKYELILCNQIKIFNDTFSYKKNNFKYKFELLFELVTGIELQDEQMERYISIINSFILYDKTYNNIVHDLYEPIEKSYNNNLNIINYETKIISGGSFNYPLHHIMMSKGKSAILTPLIALHFVLIFQKEVYIIVPEHLKDSTFDRIKNYLHLIKYPNMYFLETV